MFGFAEDDEIGIFLGSVHGGGSNGAEVRGC